MDNRCIQGTHATLCEQPWQLSLQGLTGCLNRHVVVDVAIMCIAAKDE